MIRKIINAYLVIYLMFFPHALYALPEFTDSEMSDVSVETDDNQMEITVSGDQIIPYESFSIGDNETVKFIQDSENNAVLNRVLGSGISRLDGLLEANGKVFLINQNGILIGSVGVVDTASFLASTLDISDSDFYSGNIDLSGDSGLVENKGTINVDNGGWVALVGDRVENSGTIKGGEVALVAGENVKLDFNGDGLISFEVDGGSDVLNKGIIKGGAILLTAEGSSSVLKDVVNNNGTIEATSIVNDGGVIRLVSQHGGVKNKGTIKANQGQVEINAKAFDNEGEIKAPSGEVTILIDGKELVEDEAEESPSSEDISTEDSTADTTDSTVDSEEVTTDESTEQAASTETTDANAEEAIADSEVDTSVDTEEESIIETSADTVDTETENADLDSSDSSDSETVTKDDLVSDSEIGEFKNSGLIDVSGILDDDSDYGGDIVIQAKNVSNSGEFIAGSESTESDNGGTIEIQTTEGLTNENEGSVQTQNGSVDIKSGGDVSNKGTIEVKGDDSSLNIQSKEGEINSTGSLMAVDGTMNLKAKGDVISKGELRAEILNEKGATFILGGECHVGEATMTNDDFAANYDTGNYSGTYNDPENINILSDAVVTLTGNTVFNTDSNLDGIGGLFTMNSGSSIVGSGFDLTITSRADATLLDITGIGSFILDAEDSGGNDNTINANGDISCVDFTLSSGSFVSDSSATNFSVSNDFSITGGTFKRFAGGDGSGGDPYQITDVYGLQGMEFFRTDDFVLNNNIDASVTSNWNGEAGFNPVGDNVSKFTGSLDGDGYTIDQLFINRSENYVGLFGWAENADISDVGLTNADITNAGLFTGGVAGVFAGGGGTMDTVYVTGSVSSNGSGGTGGLAGNNGGALISNSYVTADVSGNTYTGGLVGYFSDLLIDNCYATGAVSGAWYTGGLVGSTETNAEIKDSYFTGSVSNTGTYAGGITGFIHDQSILNNTFYDIDNVSINSANRITAGGVYNSMYTDWFGSGKSLTIGDYASLSLNGGYYEISNVQGLKDLLGFSQVAANKYRLISDIDLTGDAEFYVPYFGSNEFDGDGYQIQNMSLTTYNGMANIGFMGYAVESTIKNVGIVDGTINSTTSRLDGLLVGYSTNSTIQNSFSTGSVSGSIYAGGLVGYSNDGTIENSYSTASAAASTNTAGGLTGYYRDSTITNCYATGAVTGAAELGGITGRSAGTNTITNVFWNYETAGLASTQDGGNPAGELAGITSRTSAQMQDQANFTGWDFTVAGDGTIGNWIMVGDSAHLQMEHKTNISTVEELQMMVIDLTADYTLTGNIDASSTSSWRSGAGFDPVGDATNDFTGSLDGSNYTIDQLFIDQATNDVGLFGSLDGATVSNLNMTNVDITNTGVNTGAIAGQMSNSSLIDNVSVSGDVVSTGNYVGGIVGYTVSSTVRDSDCSADVSGTAYGTGGITAYTAGSTALIDNCFASGSITGEVSTGGLSGVLRDLAVIRDSYFTGDITATTTIAIGALVGYFYNRGELENSFFNIDAVTINGANLVDKGGLYNGMYTDWMNNSKSLNINDYSSLTLNNGYYEMNSVQGLKDLLGFCEESSYKFRLTNDIDLTGETDFYIPYFGGSEFDGQGYQIKNMNLQNLYYFNHVGFFGYVNQSTIKNLGVTDASIANTTNAGVGLLIGMLSFGDAEDCFSTGNVTGAYSVGGLIGNSHVSSVNDCYTLANVTSTNRGGGLFGYLDSGSASNCYAKGTVNGSSEMGGIAAHYLSGATTTNMYWDYETAGLGATQDSGNNGDEAGALSLTTAQMSDSGNFSGWSFTNASTLTLGTWIMSSNGPRLQVEKEKTISTLDELQIMALDLSSDYTLLNNIDASATSSWNSGAGFNPIGDNNNPFTGSFDGGGYTIDQLYFNSTSDYVGLFGYVDGASIYNLGLTNVSLSTSGDYSGAIAGKMSGGATLSNVYSTGSVSSSAYYTGGLVGESDNSTIEGSYSSANVDGGIQFTGGLAGRLANSSALINNSYSTGSVIGGISTGGLCGSIRDQAEIRGSYFAGDVNARSNIAVGVLVGYIFNRAKLNNSFYNIDHVTLNGLNLVDKGGIYNSMYNDWMNNGKSLNINDYSSLKSNEGYYEIDSVQGLKDLLGFTQVIGYKFRLTDDIDLSGEKDLCVPFFGADEFDGQGYKIKNMNLDSYNYINHLGFFGYVNQSTIKNLGIVDGTISNQTNAAVGMLIGHASFADVENCYTTGDVNAWYGAGGLVGYNHVTTVENSYSLADVKVKGNRGGGLFGYLIDSTLNDSYAHGSVNGQSDLGGIAGHALGSNSISNVYWDHEQAGLSSSNDSGNNGSLSGVSSKTTDEMKNEETFDGWSFDEWIMAGLPHLQHEHRTEITTLVELQLMQVGSNKDYSLENNIDADDTASWNNGEGFDPISGFSGSFDGNGYSISGLTINRSGNNIGLFGSADNASISDFDLSDASITGFSNVGALIGSADSTTVSNVDVSGTLSGSNNVGGFFGYAKGISVSDTSMNMSISNSSSSKGGYIGYLDTGVSNSFSNNVWSSNTAGISQDYDVGNIGLVNGITNTDYKATSSSSSVFSQGDDQTGVPIEQEIVLVDPNVTTTETIIHYTEIPELTADLAAVGLIENISIVDASADGVINLSAGVSDLEDIQLGDDQLSTVENNPESGTNENVSLNPGEESIETPDQSESTETFETEESVETEELQKESTEGTLEEQSDDEKIESNEETKDVEEKLQKESTDLEDESLDDKKANGQKESEKEDEELKDDKEKDEESKNEDNEKETEGEKTENSNIDQKEKTLDVEQIKNWKEVVEKVIETEEVSELLLKKLNQQEKEELRKNPNQIPTQVKEKILESYQELKEDVKNINENFDQSVVKHYVDNNAGQNILENYQTIEMIDSAFNGEVVRKVKNDIFVENKTSISEIVEKPLKSSHSQILNHVLEENGNSDFEALSNHQEVLNSALDDYDSADKKIFHGDISNWSKIHDNLKNNQNPMTDFIKNEIKNKTGIVDINQVDINNENVRDCIVDGFNKAREQIEGLSVNYDQTILKSYNQAYQKAQDQVGYNISSDTIVNTLVPFIRE